MDRTVLIYTAATILPALMARNEQPGYSETEAIYESLRMAEQMGKAAAEMQTSGPAELADTAANNDYATAAELYTLYEHIKQTHSAYPSFVDWCKGRLHLVKAPNNA
jgi:hypothetical protein